MKSILSVVAMVHHLPFPGDTSERYFVVEKMLLLSAVLRKMCQMNRTVRTYVFLYILTKQ